MTQNLRFPNLKVKVKVDDTSIDHARLPVKPILALPSEPCYTPGHEPHWRQPCTDPIFSTGSIPTPSGT